MSSEQSEFKYSFLASIYCGESPENLREALDSMVGQTIKPDEIVIIKDGHLTPQLEWVFDHYCRLYPNLFRIIAREKNEGLGVTLQAGVLECRNEWIARMDTDDICAPNRIEIQLEILKQHPDLDMIASVYYEYDNNISRRVVRITPESHEELLKYAHTRNPFGHDSMLLRKSMILKAGNYQPSNRFEDYDLWIRMFQAGAKAYNIQVPLLYVRGNEDFYARRGGWKYFKKNYTFFVEHRKSGFFTFMDCIRSLVPRFIICMMPNNMRVFTYRNLLREKATRE